VRDIFCVVSANGTLNGYGMCDYLTQSAMYSGIQNVKRMPKVKEMPRVLSFEYRRAVI
jgi:hypothetical protein